MRITSSMYYKGLYSENNSQLQSKLFNVNKQIASTFKIQYAKDDVRTFTETMRLDNEITTLNQIKTSVSSAYKVSDQTDSVLNEFETSMKRMSVLLLQAANGTNSETSLDSISDELRGIEGGLKGLANTSINGQYLFAGSAVDIKPISEDGTYNGNDVSMKAFLGSGTQQEYNVTGSEMFLGEEVLVRRQITTNVVNDNLIADYPALQNGLDSDTAVLTEDSTIRNLMGDTDNVVDAGTAKHYFYIRGTKSNGDSFNEKISLIDDDTVSSLLTRIGDFYGNTPSLDVVNVSMNQDGQIVIEDKIKGSSKLDFHMVGAVDFSGGGAADVTTLDSLDSGESDFAKIMLSTSTAADPTLYVKEFVKSPYASATGAATNIDGILYDRTQFSKESSSLTSNVSQIVNSDNSYATDKTKLYEVFSGVTYNADGTYASGLDGKVIQLEGMSVNGLTTYDVTVNLLDAGSTYTVNSPLPGGTFDIFSADSARSITPAGDVTYKQLLDIINIAVTGSIPTANTAVEFDSKLAASNNLGGTNLTYDGKIAFRDTVNANTAGTISMYDSNSGDITAAAPVSTFNTNNSLTIKDPKTDFFKTIDEIISAVEDYKSYPDSSSGDMRNVGIQNAIAMVDDLKDHISRVHSLAGAQSNILTVASERTEVLEISTQALRSSVIDTDIAEASLTLTQLTLNYEAMLSTVGRISQLSLVNYL